MKKNLVLATILLLSMAFTAWGAVPPPPVNQILGIADSTFTNLAEADCRTCHNQNPPIEAVDPTYLPDRHHLLVGTLVPAGSDIPNNPDAAGNYDCLSCHSSVFNPVTFAFELEIFRDCLFCHTQGAGEATVHHATQLAEDQDCVACHGSLINNPLDGHFIPTYQPSLVTPWPSNKPNGDVNGEGNCNFCHNTQALPANSSIPVDENGVLVFQNDETHHSTGFILDGAKCVWCHFQGQTVPQAQSIRTCENCHGVSSVHNIQADSPNAANLGEIVPGSEDAYYGHIGANDDCYGCHGNNGVAMDAAPYSGPLVPVVYTVSASSVVEGSEVVMTIEGSALVNTITYTDPQTGELVSVDAASVIVLFDKNGVEAARLTPSSITSDKIVVTIPAYLSVGTYKVVALKGDKLSNPKKLNVTPKVEAISATCTNGTVTISGSGFNAYFDADNSGTSVTSGSTMGRVSSWSDSEIVVKFAGCVAEVNVDTMFGSTTVPVEGDVVAAPAPEIRKLNRTSGRTGKIRTIYGANFGTAAKVMFGGIEATVTRCTDGAVKFKVPQADRGYYMISVVVGEQTSNEIRFRKR